LADVHINAGTLLANANDRTISGLLLPYGEVGNTDLGKFSIARGTVSIPTDPVIVGLNTDHAREASIGRAATLTDTDAGIMATFSVARTAAGDAALADATDPNGKRRKLSAEVSNIVLKAGALVSGALFGSALVGQGAFPSATLLAADAGDAADVELYAAAEEAVVPDPDATGPVVTVDESSESFTAPDGSTQIRTTKTTTTVDGATTTIETLETITEPDPVTEPASTDPNGTEAMGASTLTARTAKTPTTLAPRTATPAGMSFVDLTRTLGRAKATGDSGLFAKVAADAGGAESLFAALADVTIEGAGGAINGLPQWLGELWNGRAFQRRVIPLIGSGPLTALKVAGWRWLVEPEMSSWAGFPNPVPSNVPTTESYEVTAERFAGAHSVGREYRDFDVPGFWDGYFRGMTQSYDQQADAMTLSDLLLAAQPVTRGTVPASVSAGMTSIVDGALSIIDRGIPSFAVVNKDDYREILLTRNDDTLTYLNAAMGLEEGTIENFRVIPHSTLAAGEVLVGAKEAATSHELAGVPIRVEGLDMVRGGIDPGVFGYAATVVHDAKALALVTPGI
jgi:hypothetical protein